MRSFLRKEFWDDRNKPILFIQWVLIIFAIILYFQTYDRIDYIYSGILRLIAGIIILLTGIENYIVKKRDYIFWFILTIMFCGRGIDILMN
ncbi:MULTISPECIES: hypothetical protein [unclassified Peribacillus]|uniref:hypothetical protein n=1 Tax=unclassified Peribacillus TaxID=2675266 RepID=UPI001911EEFB|nr:MULTISPECIES: hypothetical protein [unclassified Peribacillus]MBK5442214.1 hypothetical protein [Peribacillus sp. TH24]MBK5501220.1 hypothetical protein [Peribacillus sp. TH14]WMX53811.1 hypothetical protein RE409_17170 [Peribacillus sp. R9-11]